MAVGAVNGAAAAVALLEGIPQAGGWLGTPDAGIQLVVTSTPTFFAGTKGKYGSLAVTALEVGPFKAALDKLINAK